MVDFVKIKKYRLKIVQDTQAAPIKSSMSRSIITIQELMSAIRENISLDTPNVETLKQDKCELDNLSDEMWDCMCKLNSVKRQDEALQFEVYEIQRALCGLNNNNTLLIIILYFNT